MNADQLAVPFNRACFAGTELDHVLQAVGSGHISGDGSFTDRCERWLEERVGCTRALLTTSCTHALEAAALLLDVGPGDEVIVPSFTFVSTANAFALRGATIRFADVRVPTLNLDPDHVAHLVTDRTRAIVPVHYGGVSCEMDRLATTAEEVGAHLIEDNAHGLLGTFRGQPLGSIGAMATQSFHETKNFTCGEGGALLLNDPRLVERAEIIRQKGTNRSRFLRGQVDKYTWVDLGSSWVMSDILAAILWSQFEVADSIQERRRSVWNRYHDGLRDWASAEGAELPVVPSDREQSFHLYYVLLPEPETRDRFIAHLRARDILAVFHYQPLHLSTMGRRLGGAPGDCPVTESVAGRLVRLPFFHDLAPADQDMVIDAAREFRV